MFCFLLSVTVQLCSEPEKRSQMIILKLFIVVSSLGIMVFRQFVSFLMLAALLGFVGAGASRRGQSLLAAFRCYLSIKVKILAVIKILACKGISGGWCNFLKSFLFSCFEKHYHSYSTLDQHPLLSHVGDRNMTQSGVSSLFLEKTAFNSRQERGKCRTSISMLPTFNSGQVERFSNEKIHPLQGFSAPVKQCKTSCNVLEKHNHCHLCDVKLR